MTPEFDSAVARARTHGLKVGPIAERPGGLWRAYVQKGDELMRCAEGPSVEAALAGAIDAAVKSLAVMAKVSHKPSALLE